MKKSLMIGGIIIIAIFAAGYIILTKVRPLPTQLTVAPSETTISWGDSAVLTATLTSSGNFLEGENISWSFSPEWWGASVSPDSSITNSSGQASVSFTAIYLLSVKPQKEITFTITASFAGDNRYQESTGSASVVVIPF